MCGVSESQVTDRGPDKIRSIDLAGVFVRSLSIQSSWNFSRMQNVGFAYALGPVVRRMGTTERKRREILTRHVERFNSHPYFSAPILGAVVRLEEECIDRDECQGAVEMKKTLMSPYAAVGDPFFWGGMKPMAAAIGVLLAFKGFLLAPLVFLLLYNSVHIWFRVQGFIEGYRDGKGAFQFIGSIRMADKIRNVKWVAVAALAALASVIMEKLPFSIAGMGDLGARLLMIPVIIVCVFMIRKGVSVFTILYGSVCFLLIFSLLRVSGGL